MFDGEMITNLESETVLNSHVEVEEVKATLHIDESETDDDARIARLIKAAADDAKAYCDHYFSLTELYFLGFNWSVDKNKKIRISPFQSLVSFEISDDNSVWTDITNDVFVEKRLSDFTIHFNGGLESDYVRYKVRVGYEDGKLPEGARDAIIVKAGDKFDTESSSYASKLDNHMAFEKSLAPYVNLRWEE